MNNSSFSFARPAVLIASAVISESIIILNFTHHRQKILIFIICAALLTLLVMLLLKCKTIAFFAALTLIIGALIPCNVYKTKEEYSNTILKSLGKDTHTYSGTVTYSSASTKPVNMRVMVTEIDGFKVKKPFSAQVTSFSGDGASPSDTIMFTGYPSALSQSDVGEFDTKSYLRSKHTFIVFSSADIISTSTSNNDSFLKFLRDKFDKAVYKYVKSGYNYSGAAITKALTLGDKTDFSKEMTKSFTQSGMSHLMCVSGLHLTVLLGMLANVLRGLTLPKKLRCFILIGFCIFYICFTGASSSVIRAGIMSTLTYIAMLIGRKNDSVITLFIAGAVMTLANPYVVLDIAARLSFVATLGVILIGNAVSPMLLDALSSHPLILHFANAVFTNIGAVVFTLPFGADSFGGFSTVSVFSTLCSSIACEFLIILANILCFLSFVPFTDIICTEIGKVCNIIANYIMWISNQFSSLKYSYVKADNTQIIFLSSMLFIALLCLFISFGASRLVRVMLILITSSSLLLCSVGIFNAIAKDSSLSVSYYRKNENDRQLGIKLGTGGHLIFNADDLICTNPEKAVFDNIDGKNYIILLPNQSTNAAVISDSLRNFSSRYGIRGIFVPETKEGLALAKSLSHDGFTCRIFPETFSYSSFTISLDALNADTYKLSVSDGKEEVFVVFSDKYIREDFKGHSDICAYFTRTTKTQFDTENDTLPQCRRFITRTQKGYSADRLFNTFGETSFMLKE